LPEDEEDDSWLDEPAEVYPAARTLKAEKSSPINLSASVHLKTFLADEKLEGVMPENSGLKASDLERVVQHTDDNDFSMDL
jgi:hypothetical protein